MCLWLTVIETIDVVNRTSILLWKGSIAPPICYERGRSHLHFAMKGVNRTSILLWKGSIAPPFCYERGQVWVPLIELFQKSILSYFHFSNSNPRLWIKMKLVALFIRSWWGYRFWIEEIIRCRKKVHTQLM